MTKKTMLVGALTALALGAMGGVVACGNKAGAGSAANVQAGAMPDGESWVGVYFHPVFGFLHLEEQSDHVVGKWKRADQSAWGEMSGTRQGNVVHFTWKEHKIGMVGPSADSHGKGVFVYKIGANSIPELDGSYGVDENEVGSTWNQIKQKNMKPDLASIPGRPDLAVPVGGAGGKWE